MKRIGHPVQFVGTYMQIEYLPKIHHVISAGLIYLKNIKMRERFFYYVEAK